MSQRPLNFSFRRALVGDKLTTWHNLAVRIANIQLSEDKDSFNWDLHNHGQFLVQSMYQFLINQDIPFTKKFFWKLKLPLKINIFL